MRCCIIPVQLVLQEIHKTKNPQTVIQLIACAYGFASLLQGICIIQHGAGLKKKSVIKTLGKGQFPLQACFTCICIRRLLMPSLQIKPKVIIFIRRIRSKGKTRSQHQKHQNLYQLLHTVLLLVFIIRL